MDHEVAVVDQDPAAFLGTLQTKLVLTTLLHLGVDLAGDGMTLPPRIRGGDHEEIEQRGRLPQVEENDFLGPVQVGDPGREPGVLERLVDPVGITPINGLGGVVILNGPDRTAPKRFLPRVGLVGEVGCFTGGVFSFIHVFR